MASTRLGKCLVILCGLVLPSMALAQESPELSPKEQTLSPEEQSALIARRDKLGAQAMALANKGQFEQASEMFADVLKIETSLYGETHPELLGTLDYIARVAEITQDADGQIQARQQAFQIGRRLFPPQHYRLRDLQLALDEAQSNAKRTAEQRDLLRQAKEASKNVVALYQQGKYDEALALGQKRLDLFGQVLGKRSSSYASSLNDLAQIHIAMGDYAKALPLCVESLEIDGAVLGKEHPTYAGSLNNLASLYQELGQFAKAVPLYQESTTTLRKTLGDKNPRYATSVNNLAQLYVAMGDFKRALSLHIKAREIRKAALGDQHPEYATSLINLGAVYDLMKEFSKAEPLYVECRSIIAKTLGKTHPEYAGVLNNLARLYQRTGQLAKAEPLYQESKALCEEKYGKEHSRYASSVNNLATLYVDMGKLARAEPLLVEVKSIFEAAYGKQHPKYANSLNNLANLKLSQGNHEQAAQDYRQSIDISLAMLEATALSQSEQQQLSMSQSIRYVLDNYLHCCLEGDLDPNDAIERLVLWKGAAFLRARDLRVLAADPAINEKFQKLQSISSELSSTWRSTSSMDRQASKKQMEDLSEAKHQLEVELSRESGAFREARQPTTLDDIRETIPPDGVLLDFLICAGRKDPTIVCSVLRRDGEAELIDLGSAEEVGKAIDLWRKSYGMTPIANSAGTELRDRLWQPLLPHLSGANLILVSTDGALGRLPFAALPGAKSGTYLIEDHRIALIPVPQLLPRLLVESKASDSKDSMLLIGNVDYGVGKEADRWPGLPETEREVEFIKRLVGDAAPATELAITDLRGEAATETAFRRWAPESRFLHLATHGFFASAERKSALSPKVVQAAARRSPPRRESSDPVVLDSVSPSQLSGLVLSGANREAGKAPQAFPGPDKDDGIMTADEIAYLPLQRTELAVLSACETGLGEVAGGEGLIGIQRAFQVAGADSVVATLWKVDDAMTRKLMERFYQNLFAKKMSKLDALREAQLWAIRHPKSVEQSIERGSVRKLKPPVKASGQDAAGQDAVDKTNPYYWAPFVLSGDWR